MCRYSASLLLVLVCCLHVREGRCGGPVDAPDWRAGVAVAVITPERAMMLAGFASRREPAEGTASELHAKAVAVEDAEGTRLATAVEAALENRQRTVRGPLRLGYDHVTLNYQEAPTREQLEATAEGRADAPFRSFELTAAHAQRLLRQLDREGRLAESYDCPVQTVQFGDDLILVALSGEVVVDYSLRLKRELAGEAAVWVSGYNNDVFAYVPSRRVLEEGGYEPRRSMNYYTTTLHPGPFAVSIEDRIVARVLALLGKAAATPGDSSAAHQSRSN